MSARQLCPFVCIILVFFGSVSMVNASPDAAVFDVTGDWEAIGDLPWQAMTISLQGLANKDAARLYLMYPDDYKHPDVREVYEFYQTRHAFEFDSLETPEAVLERFHSHASGYVVWDREVLPSLMVAYTLAGLENAVIVTGRWIEAAQGYDLREIKDFRGRFQGMSDVEIFEWAYETYGPRCSKTILTYLGERCVGLNGNPGMWPAIADFGMVQGSFFTDLSTSPVDEAEFHLADRIMGDMDTYGYVFGWHSYCKDQEPEHLTLVSQNALVIAEGLNTLPNMSFHQHVEPSGDFTFKQKARFNPDPPVEDKVYLTMIQSDGLGIGSWTRPGRGSVPYGWEANMEWLDFAPALLQYYYESATPNDTFIGSLSGPGYFYPKQYPPEKLPGALQIADEYMEQLDLHVFGIMDYSDGDRKVGHVDLPERVVDAYYENMPHVKGFLCGYGPGNTYDHRNERPFISYNYYLEAEKSIEDVVLDIRELARLNPERPYFLPVHVRENNQVQRVKEIFDRLGSEFEMVPPREFMILAGKAPTMTTRFVSPHPDFSGIWQLDRKQSAGIFPTTVRFEIDHRESLFDLTTTCSYHRMIHHRDLKTHIPLTIGGRAVTVPEWRTRRMGYMSAWGDSLQMQAHWTDTDTLVLTSEMMVETSQGIAGMKSTLDFHLSKDRMTLTVLERRQTRESSEPVTRFVFKRVLSSLPAFE